MLDLCDLHRQLVEDTMMGHENAKKAKKKLQQYKQKLGEQIYMILIYKFDSFCVLHLYWLSVSSLPSPPLDRVM